MCIRDSIYAQQNENKDNPHKTKHVDECMKALGKVGSNHYSNSDDTGMAQTFNAPYFLDVIGTSYCRSRAIAVLKMSTSNLKLGELQKLI